VENIPGLAELLDGLLPRTERAVCPRCGARLYVHVTLYASMPLQLRIWEGKEIRAESHGPILETKKELQEQADYESGRIGDEREEIHCSRCEWWATVFDIEFRDALEGNRGPKEAK